MEDKWVTTGQVRLSKSVMEKKKITWCTLLGCQGGIRRNSIAQDLQESVSLLLFSLPSHSVCLASAGLEDDRLVVNFSILVTNQLTSSS